MHFEAPIKSQFQYGNHQVKIESGHIAHQATASVLVTMGKCIVMANITEGNPAHGDFFPLAVHYTEKAYSAGKIPGSFNRREGRPSTREVLICRVIDRALRPMFADGFKNEVVVNITLLQNDKEVQPDIPAFIAASAAISLTHMPFETIAAARVGRINDDFVLNPSLKELETSTLDLIIAGKTDSYVMVESSAKELSEQIHKEALAFGQNALQGVIEEIKKIKQAHGKPCTWQAEDDPTLTAMLARVSESTTQSFEEALAIPGKKERNAQLKQIAAAILEKEQAALNTSDMDYGEKQALLTLTAQRVDSVIYMIKKSIIRRNILDQNLRIDGRSTDSIRPITVVPRFLPETHGSALFVRGETQALVTTTLSAQESSAQLLDDITSSVKQYDHFMLHYNMPGYSVGECSQPLSPKRREIGHGELAKRALLAVMPDSSDDFSYITRVVSEILSCNGSSSMATVCGSSLALMDAGVPLKAAVAGIAMGLIKGETKHAVLSDILGDEDAFGDMDFKVAGTENGITALQMDIKINGITEAILTDAMEQARQGRLHILGEMNKELSMPRAEISSNAPRVIQFNIPTTKIREVIGRGGATIREIIDKYSVVIDISDDGVVKISAEEESQSLAAQAHIEEMIKEVELGVIYEGRVTDLLDFGAKVNIMNNKEAFLHISQISHSHIDNIRDELSPGQIIKVRVAEIDKRMNRIKLSMKDVVQ